MAPGRTSDRQPAGRPQRLVEDAAVLRRFLRCSHIFSAAVRQIVDSRQLVGDESHPLTLPQIQLLRLIAKDGPHTLGDAAVLLGVSSPAATKCVDKLERLGLVARVPSTTDRRTVLLEASREGQQLVVSYERVKKRRLNPVLGDFSPREIDRMIDLLERFAVAHFARQKPPREACLCCGAYIEEDCPIARVRGTCPYLELRDDSSSEVSPS